MTEKPLSAPCYHKKHEECPGSEHCGCDCHVELKLSETEGAAGPTMIPEDAFLEVVGQVDYYRERLLQEMDRNHQLTKSLEELTARLAGMKSVAGNKQSTS